MNATQNAPAGDDRGAKQHTSTSNNTAPATIEASLDVLYPPGSVIELRILNTGRTGTVSGYFDDYGKLADEAAKWSGKAPGVYTTLNPVMPALLARANNRAKSYAKQTTSDQDIEQRRWLPLDFDPVRPAGISSTDEEHEAANERARQVTKNLQALGWPDPVAADSGNGGHLMYRIDLPNDAETKDLVQVAIEAIAEKFSDDVVEIDLGVYNAARIWKVYGTMACKGDVTADRPHRLAKLLHVPDQVEIVSREQLEVLAATVAKPAPAPRQALRHNGKRFDIAEFVQRHGLRTNGPVLYEGGQKWVFSVCPWNVEHTDNSAYLIEHPSGAISAGCHHNGCADNDWRSLREKYDPGCYSNPKAPDYFDGYTPHPSRSMVSNLPETSRIPPAAGSIPPAKLAEGALIRKASRLIESEAAEIVAAALVTALAWDGEAGTWLIWTGTHWEPLTQNAKADKLLADSVHTGTDPLGFKPTYLNGVVQIVCRRGLLPVPVMQTAVVPFINGLLNIKTGQLDAATPEQTTTWILPHEYKRDAACPNIRAWLLKAVDNDGDTVELLRAWMAALVRGIALQYFLMVQGPGGSGKGVFQRLVVALVGTRNTAISTLRDLEENRFETAKLYGKRLCMINETGGHGGSVNMLKAITGGDHLPLERKHVQQTGSFVFAGLVLMAGNEDLQTNDSTSGLERRRLIVRFNRRATPEEKADWEARGGEAQVIHTEIPGLVRWLLEMPIEEIHERIQNPPQRIAAANLLGMAAGNSVADWLMENCIPDKDAWVQIGKKKEHRSQDGGIYYENADEWLYPNYLNWCQEAGRNRPLALRKFRSTVSDMAEQLGHPVEDGLQPTTKRAGIQGLRIRNQTELQHDWLKSRAIPPAGRDAGGIDPDTTRLNSLINREKTGHGRYGRYNANFDSTFQESAVNDNVKVEL